MTVVVSDVGKGALDASGGPLCSHSAPPPAIDFAVRMRDPNGMQLWTRCRGLAIQDDPVGGIMPDHLGDRGAVRLDLGASRSPTYQAESDASAWPLGSPDGGAGPREVDARYLGGTWQAGQCRQPGARSPLAGCARAMVMPAGLRRSGGSADGVRGCPWGWAAWMPACTDI
jgi:hypothetical protein